MGHVPCMPNPHERTRILYSMPRVAGDWGTCLLRHWGLGTWKPGHWVTRCCDTHSALSDGPTMGVEYHSLPFSIRARTHSRACARTYARTQVRTHAGTRARRSAISTCAVRACLWHRTRMASMTRSRAPPTQASTLNWLYIGVADGMLRWTLMGGGTR